MLYGVPRLKAAQISGSLLVNEPLAPSHTCTTMAAQSLAASFLRDHPNLRPFLLSYARATGRTIGSGSYGSVEEVAIPGAVCAAKKIHDFFQDPRQTAVHYYVIRSATPKSGIDIRKFTG